jgi:hypothetical protein
MGVGAPHFFCASEHVHRRACPDWSSLSHQDGVTPGMVYWVEGLGQAGFPRAGLNPRE